MTETLKCITPVDGSVYVERPLADDADVAAALAAAQAAQAGWRRTAVAERQALLTGAVDAFVAKKAEISEEIAWQMGRPISQCPFEVAGFEERARHMIAIAPQALADIAVEPKEGFTRFIRRDPLGVAFVVAPWNYPYLTAVNAVIPALMAGNAISWPCSSPSCSSWPASCSRSVVEQRDWRGSSGAPYGGHQASSPSAWPWRWLPSPSTRSSPPPRCSTWVSSLRS